MMAATPKIINASLIIIASAVLIALLSVGSSVFAPVAFALFVIVLVWPVQRNLQTVMPQSVAFLVTFTLVGLVVLVFGWMIAWAFGHVARAVIADAGRFQQLYDHIQVWLEEHGIVVGVFSTDNFSVSWVLRMLQTVGNRLNSMFSFWVVTLLYVLLGLLEVSSFESRIRALKNQVASGVLLNGSLQTAMKIRHYMLVRTWMSIATGLLVWLFARAVGLPLAEEWGVIAFVLNYIPFLGPLVATVFPTAFAATQFGDWQIVAAVFCSLNLIQFVVGSYIEPRFTGNALSISPAAVLFFVLAWSAFWGIFGAFIGVPIMIAILTFCAQHPSSRWFAELFGSGEPYTKAPRC